MDTSLNAAEPSRPTTKRNKKRFIDPKSAVSFRVVHRSQRDTELAKDGISQFVLAQLPPSRNLQKVFSSFFYCLTHLLLWQSGKFYQNRIPDDLVDNIAKVHLDATDLDYANNELDKFEDSEDIDDNNWEDANGSDIETNVPDKPSKKSNFALNLLDEAIKEDVTMHGIFFDDYDRYDYMQHMKVIGEDPQAVFVASKKSEKLIRTGIQFKVNEIVADSRQVRFELPEEALPSTTEMEVGLLNLAATSSVLDVQPSVREIMYALEDEAYVDNDIDEDFFAALDADEPPEGAILEEELSEEENNEEWYNQFKKFQKNKDKLNNDDEDSDDADNDNEPAPRHRTSKTSTTAYSMTSSALFRNKHLTLLDNKFEQVLASYDEDSESDDSSDPHQSQIVPQHDNSDNSAHAYSDVDSTTQGQTTLSRMQNEAMDAILLHTDVSRKRMKEIPAGGGMGEFAAMRAHLMNGVEIADILAADERIEQRLEKKLPADMEFVRPERKERDKWDVETVLSTYSNVYNHPKIISETKEGGVLKGKKGARILLGRDGMPLPELWRVNKSVSEDEEIDEEVGDEEFERVNKGIARNKSETKEDKRARKEALKEDRKNRRVEKKATKTAFKDEKTKQLKGNVERSFSDKIRPIA
ncbi:hypothetical protein HK096_000029 [Nowakowskiella sp. JEL0078]|nr:hypothetical protein HK096_000029 [Nowakowskiella sp. JEL0078]